MRLVFATALFLAPATVLASTPQDGASAETAAPAPVVKEKKVCKVVDNGSTSRMRQKVCRTVKEWSETTKKSATTADLERLSR